MFCLTAWLQCRLNILQEIITFFLIIVLISIIFPSSRLMSRMSQTDQCTMTLVRSVKNMDHFFKKNKLSIIAVKKGASCWLPWCVFAVLLTDIETRLLRTIAIKKCKVHGSKQNFRNEIWIKIKTEYLEGSFFFWYLDSRLLAILLKGTQQTNTILSR